MRSRAPAVGADREAAADDLAERGEVGPRRRSVSCAPPGATRKPVITSSKTRSAPWRVAERAQARRKSGPRRDDAHVPGHRLDDDRRDLVGLHAAKQRLDAREVVVLRDERVARGRLGDAGAVGHAEGRDAPSPP